MKAGRAQNSHDRELRLFGSELPQLKSSLHGPSDYTYVIKRFLGEKIERRESGIVFREAPPGQFLDWHSAPRRQYIVQLAGEVEIGLGDGSTVRYQPGDARLVADTTGQGHTTRVIGDQPSITAVIPLAD